MVSSVTSVITSGTPERASALSGPEQIQESSSEIFGVNAFTLKIIVIITMTIDHIVFFRVFDFYQVVLENTPTSVSGEMNRVVFVICS